MADCMLSTSGRDELSEKQKEALGGMWVYVQPISLYRHIEHRHQAQVGLGGFRVVLALPASKLRHAKVVSSILEEQGVCRLPFCEEP